jgi:hypothetical protein
VPNAYLVPGEEIPATAHYRMGFAHQSTSAAAEGWGGGRVERLGFPPPTHAGGLFFIGFGYSIRHYLAKIPRNMILKLLMHGETIVIHDLLLLEHK